MKIISRIIFVLVFIVGIVFAFLNHTSVMFNYYVGSTQISLSLLIILSFGFGILLGLLCSMLYWIKLKAEIHSLKSHIKQSEK